MARLTETAPILEARDVAKHYGGLRAVDGVSLALRAGEVLGVAGPNGAGKTTLFDVLSGHVAPTRGEIVLEGRSLTGATVHQRAQAGLARTFQRPTVAGSLTVLENAYLAAAHRRGRSGGRAGDLVVAERELERAGLTRVRRSVAGTLPVYDRKRLMIASALATEPRVLLLDEPFGGLNPGEIDETLALLRGVRDGGVPLLCIEHVMRALVALADRVLVLHHGASLFEGTPDEMLRDASVVDVYLGTGRERAS